MLVRSSAIEVKTFVEVVASKRVEKRERSGGQGKWKGGFYEPRQRATKRKETMAVQVNIMSVVT